jgi:hypothetical protein
MEFLCMLSGFHWVLLNGGKFAHCTDADFAAPHRFKQVAPALNRCICSTRKTRSPIEGTTLSKNWIKQLHTLPVLHFNRFLTTEYSETTANFNGNFDTGEQIYAPQPTCTATFRTYCTIIHCVTSQKNANGTKVYFFPRFDINMPLYPTTNRFKPLKTKRRPLYIKTQSVPHSKHFSSYTKHRPLYLNTQSVPRSKNFSTYTKHSPLYLITQSVPRSKYFSSYNKHSRSI